MLRAYEVRDCFRLGSRNGPRCRLRMADQAGSIPDRSGPFPPHSYESPFIRGIRLFKGISRPHLLSCRYRSYGLIPPLGRGDQFLGWRQ
jgi:hypothetical protein